MAFGLLNLDKPAGLTSHDVVARVRRMLPRSTKVGHAGTLDPLASGVLVVCVGPATRLADRVQAGIKGYRATVRLGAVSSTDDGEGELTTTPSPPRPDAQQILTALERFVGELRQVPPAHSAVHVQGRRAYHLARAGERVALAARTVHVHALEMVSYDWPDLEIDVTCGRGTYIRSLARDIGAELDTGGYCHALRRTRVGPFTVDQAVPLASLDAETLNRHLLPAQLALGEMPTVRLSEAEVHLLRQGRPVPCNPPAGEPTVAALDPADRLVALCTPDSAGRQLHPNKVFPA